MARCFKRRFIRLYFMAALLGALPLSGHAEETLTWLVRDLPPMTIFEGPQKSRGTVDQLLSILIERLPEYRHQILHVNRARGLQMLQAPSFTCDPSLLWTPTRARSIVFSTPAFAVVANGVTIRRSQQAALAPFIADGQFDLRVFLETREARLGIIAERSYGPLIDERLQQAAPHKLVAHYGNDAIGSLLQMQQRGRLEVVLGYWPEVRYQAQQQNIDPQGLIFYPISGSTPYQRIHIGCSDTPHGRNAMTRINQVLRRIPQDNLLQSYASWLDPVLRTHYLNDNPQFFQDAADQ